MKRFFQVILAITFLSAVLFAHIADKSERDKQELIRLETLTVTATDRRDLVTLDRLIADDFVATTSRGALKNKKETIASWTNNAPTDAQGAQTTVSVVTTLNDFNVRINGKTAIVTGLDRAVYQKTEGGETVSEARFTDIWEKRKIGWQLVAGHVSRVQPLGTSPKGESQTELEQYFKQLVEEMQNGRFSGDKAIAERTLADGYISTDEIGANGGGKERIIKSRTNPEVFKRLGAALAEAKYSQTIEDVRVEPHGETVAVNYRLVVHLVTNGEPVVKQFRCNEVFIKKDNRWQSILHTETVIPNPPFTAKIDTKIYDDYAGEYRLHQTRSYTITREADKLFFQAPGLEKIELVPENETTFAQNGGNFYRVQFVRDAQGRVTHLRIKEFSGVEYNAIKIK